MENGRYQAVATNTSVFILDVSEGHLWLWGACEETGVTLMYLGQLSVGKEPMEMLYSSKKAAKKG